MKTIFRDSNQTRYTLAASFEGKPFNWIFLPGGPGADASYFMGLINLLKLPGNSWLVDLPGNGDNIQEIPSDYDYDQWMELFVPTVKKFENTILVGQSFGGMFPLLFPDLEFYLKGFVILNSAPTLWLQEAVQYSKQFNLPDLSREMHEFTIHPNSTTFQTALMACLPYYFPAKTLEIGKKMLKNLPFQYQPAVWWQRKAIEINLNAKWIPQNVPTLIINSTHDCICPYTLFAKDRRFDRPNIEKKIIQEAGHMPWVEKPEEVKSAFHNFVERLPDIKAKIPIPV